MKVVITSSTLLANLIQQSIILPWQINVARKGLRSINRTRPFRPNPIREREGPEPAPELDSTRMEIEVEGRGGADLPEPLQALLGVVLAGGSELDALPQKARAVVPLHHL